MSISAWVQKMAEGMSRLQVADGFGESKEFKRVVNSLKK